MAGAKLLEGLQVLNKDLGVPTPKQFGISTTDWQAKKALMAEQALASGSPGNNPRVPDAAQIIALYESVYE